MSELILTERPDGIRILQISQPEHAAPYLASFVGAYQTIFAGPPYNERFSPEEAGAVLISSLQTPENLTLLAVKGQTEVVAFGMALPVRFRRDIVAALQGLIPTRHAFYLSELGVREEYRGARLGRQLIQLRLERIDARRYTHAVLRTSAIRNASYEMYMGLGFDDMGVYMEVPALRIDGSETSDRRLFLSRFLGADPD